ncbi:MAG: hypothetical protein OEZ52_01305, partial [Candidatus Aminicenantes bacterium]|nr:hypothetical protein [Candidatus Aminicenantes bacterium]
MIVSVMQIRIMRVCMFIFFVLVHMNMLRGPMLCGMSMGMMEIVVVMHVDVLQFIMKVIVRMRAKNNGQYREGQNNGRNDLEQRN